MAARVYAFLNADQEAGSDEPVADSERSWNSIRCLMAKAFAQNAMRMAQSLDIAKLAVALYLEEILHIDLPPGLTAFKLTTALQTMGVDEWSEDLHMLWAEINTV